MKEMIKRKDGSYSQRGLWDNIRANRGSGKKPTKEMLEQERKIRAKAQYGMEIPYMNIGGYFPRFMQEGGEPNGGMALGQMAAVADKMMKLRQFITGEDNLDPWIASKLAVMDHSADAIYDYIAYNDQGDEEEGEEDEMEDEEEEEEEAPMTEMELEEMKNGGIPERYRKRGFTKVGVKRQSTRPGKKWMVLAKKGDQYKIVHGGYKGMKDFTQHRNKNRQKKFWSRMGGKNSSKATDPFSPLYWHKRFGTWEDGGQLPFYQDGKEAKQGVCSKFGVPYMGGGAGGKMETTPGITREDVYEKEYYGSIPKDERKKLEQTYKSMLSEGKIPETLSVKDFIAAQGEANAINKFFKTDYYAEDFFDPNNPNVVIPEQMSYVPNRVQFYRAMVPGIGKTQKGRRELTALDIINLMPIEDRKALISRGYMQPPPQNKYGGNTNNNLNNNFMNPLYDFIQRAQMGGAQQSQEEQIMQLIAVFAQMQNVDPEQIVAQLQEMSPDEQQQALQQMVQVVQESAGDQQEQQMPAMRGGGIPCFECGGTYQSGGMMYGDTMGGPVGVPAMPVDVYGLPIYGGGGMKGYVSNPYVEDMMEMQDGGKPSWLVKAQLEAQGFSGNALQTKMRALNKKKVGGIQINPANKGKFTAKANAADMSVQGFASKVLNAPEGRYSPATRRQANFARNAANWKKQAGGMIEGLKVGDMLENVDEETLRMLDQMGIQYEIV